MKQSPSAGVHTFCDRQKPLPDGAAQYYVAGKAQPSRGPRLLAGPWVFLGQHGRQQGLVVNSKGFGVRSGL